MTEDKPLELFSGTTAGKVAGYENRSSFKYATDRYPIPDQGYRHNGSPAWTREHLQEWARGIPAAGPRKKS